MGGFGSGCSAHENIKGTTNSYLSIDVRYLKRNGLLKPNQSVSLEWSRRDNLVASIQLQTKHDHIVANYRYQHNNKPWKDECYPIYLDFTHCHILGMRPWFLCPDCDRRVAILYCNGLFACRHCHELVYESQREPSYYRAIRRADKIREKLNWPPGIANGIGPKPKAMHQKTFERLTIQHSSFVNTAVSGMAISLGIK